MMRLIQITSVSVLFVLIISTFVMMRQWTMNYSIQQSEREGTSIAANFGDLLTDMNAQLLTLVENDVAGSSSLLPDEHLALLQSMLDQSVLHTSFGARLAVFDASGELLARSFDESPAADLHPFAGGLPQADAGPSLVSLGERRYALIVRLSNFNKLLVIVDLETLLRRASSMATSTAVWTLKTSNRTDSSVRYGQKATTVRIPISAEGIFDALRYDVTGVITNEDALAPLRVFVLGWLVAVLLLVLLVGAIGRRMLKEAMKPVTELAAVAARLDQVGTTEQSLMPGRDRKDEVGVLALAFESVLDRVQRINSEQDRVIESRTRELARSQELLKTILSSIDEILVSARNGGREVLFVSEPVLRITGRAVSQVMADKEGILSLVAASHRAMLAEKIVNAGPVTAELRIPVDDSIAADTPLRWLEIRYQKDSDAPEDPVTCVIRDATRVVSLEESSLHAANEIDLRDRALAAASNGIEIIEGREAGYRVRYVNSALCRMIGFDLEELLGRPSRLLLAGAVPNDHMRRMLAAMKIGKGGTALRRTVRKNGSTFWEQIRLSPVESTDASASKFIAVHTDVTELIETANDLRVNEGRLALLFSMSPDGLMMLDADRQVFLVNEAFVSLSGIQREQLVGCSLEQVEEQLRASAKASEAWEGLPRIEDLDRFGNLESEERRKGPRHTIHLQNPKRVLVCNLRRIDTGRNEEFALYVRNVTQEHDLDQMKSEFLSTATHELRTPMACILGFAEMLSEGLSTAEDAPQHARLIYEQAREMNNTLDDLLDLARIEARIAGNLKFSPETATGLATELARTWRVPGDPRTVELVVQCGADVSVSVDHDKIRQALRNLLSNAFKYSDPASPVRLVVEAVPAGPVLFTVIDAGIGMNPEQLRRAFERFYRADDRSPVPGTGLGLSLVQQIVELHGGKVRLESEGGRGTRAIVELPQILFVAEESRAA